MALIGPYDCLAVGCDAVQHVHSALGQGLVHVDTVLLLRYSRS